MEQQDQVSLVFQSKKVSGWSAIAYNAIWQLVHTQRVMVMQALVYLYSLILLLFALWDSTLTVCF